MVLDAGDSAQILTASPDPFTPATREKVAALRHFQPHGVLISKGHQRTIRRAANEQALDTHEHLHRFADPMRHVMAQEAAELLSQVAQSGTLTWDGFEKTWWRMVRRIVLGDGARDDQQLTDLLDRLRRHANWAYAAPQRRLLRAGLKERLKSHVDRADAGSLAHLVAGMTDDPELDAVGQIPHWLFAFDAAAMTTFRTLAVLATHPEHAEKAAADTSPELPYLRACVQETVRLWPTTPGILRESTTETVLRDDVLPAGTTFLIFTPFLHRDPQLSYADTFTPELWLDGQAQNNPALIPFSGGPAECAGRNLTLFVTSTMLTMLLRTNTFTTSATLEPPLPATLNPFTLRFRVG